MNPIDQVFESARSERRTVFVPFVTAGDPDLETTCALIGELSRQGAGVVELGIPYSDPIADGPVIQASYTRALKRNITVAQIFDAVGTLTQSQPDLAPLVCMVAYSIVFRIGAEEFIGGAKAAGFSGAIIPDLPIEEASEMAELARANNFALIFLVTPTTPRERMVQVANLSTGFLYYVSVTGITGERAGFSNTLVDQVSWLRSETQKPVCIGFGISQPEHVKMLSPVADGLIVGSAIVRRIAEGDGASRQQIVSSVGEYVRTLVAAVAPG